MSSDTFEEKLKSVGQCVIKIAQDLHSQENHSVGTPLLTCSGKVRLALIELEALTPKSCADPDAAMKYKKIIDVHKSLVNLLIESVERRQVSGDSDISHALNNLHNSLNEMDLDSLEKHVEKPGQGRSPKTGDNVQIDYTLYLGNGVFLEKKVNVVVEIGKAVLCPGIHEALLNMKCGESAQLAVGSALTYGSSNETPAFLHNRDLLIDMKLIKIF